MNKNNCLFLVLILMLLMYCYVVNESFYNFEINLNKHRRNWTHDQKAIGFEEFEIRIKEIDEVYPKHLKKSEISPIWA